MKGKFIRHSLFAVPFLLGLFFIAGAISTAANHNTLTFYGVATANQLVRFNGAASGSNFTTIGTITGLQTGENIVGIDFRPLNGQLYALGSTSRLYTINLTTGAATQVGTAGAFALMGTNFGFDFNPTVDRIRVVSDTGQNLRLNPNDGTLTAADPNLNGAAAGADGAAYTNSFAGVTTTALFDINSTTDTLYQQNPANAGTLVTVGALGVDVTAINGFDIVPSNGEGYAAFTVAGMTRLYNINLQTGAATLVGTIGNGTVALRGLAVASGTATTGASALDFDGDRRADFVNYRLSNNVFYVSNSSANNALLFAREFGFAGSDIVQPGDYDGDLRADLAVFRPSNGVWYIQQSSTNTLRIVQFGTFSDQPVARDYDGDGRTDLAVVRRTGGRLLWIILQSSNNTIRYEQFGLDTDVPAPGDYDGDGRFDLAVYHGMVGQQATFFVQRTTAGFQAVQFGLGGDLVVPGDYDGDGKTDFAVVRQGTNYEWYILRSSDNSLLARRFGAKPQLTVQADYDGDGRTDIATYDPTTGTYFILQSSTNFTTPLIRRFGTTNDYPVANYNTF